MTSPDHAAEQAVRDYLAGCDHNNIPDAAGVTQPNPGAPFSVGDLRAVLAELAALRAENGSLREDVQRANGTAYLALQHREAAEAKVERLSTSLAEMIADHEQTAKNSYEHVGDTPSWNDEIWQDSNREDFERVSRARQALTDTATDVNRRPAGDDIAPPASSDPAAGRAELVREFNFWSPAAAGRASDIAAS
jgi:hypothetical protein